MPKVNLIADSVNAYLEPSEAKALAPFIDRPPFWRDTPNLQEFWITVLQKHGCKPQQIQHLSVTELKDLNKRLNQLKANAPIAYKQCRENYLETGVSHPALFNSSLEEKDLARRHLIMAEAAKLGNLALVAWVCHYESRRDIEKPHATIIDLENISEHFFVSNNLEVIAFYFDEIISHSEGMQDPQQFVQMAIQPAVLFGDLKTIDYCMKRVFKREDAKASIIASPELVAGVLSMAALRNAEIYQQVRTQILGLGMDENALNNMLAGTDFIHHLITGNHEKLAWMENPDPEDARVKMFENEATLVTAALRCQDPSILVKLKVYLSKVGKTPTPDNRFIQMSHYKSDFKALLRAYEDMESADKSNEYMICTLLEAAKDMQDFRAAYFASRPHRLEHYVWASEEESKLEPRLQFYDEQKKLFKKMVSTMQYHKPFAAAKFLASDELGADRVIVDRAFLEEVWRYHNTGETIDEQQEDGYMASISTLAQLFSVPPKVEAGAKHKI